MARTPMHVVKEWLLEALVQKGGRSGSHELVAYLEDVKRESLLPDDHLPQKGKPQYTQFTYYCWWAITTLRGEGKIKRGSPRGIVELENSVSDGSRSYIEGEGLDRLDTRSINETSNRGIHRYYNQTCGQLLEKYVNEHFNKGVECHKNEIMAWFAEHYPFFKPITVQCTISQHTTNYRSRVHYNAGPEHDLLFRVNDDWDRLRLYQPEDDPPPIYEIERKERTPSDVRKLKGKPGSIMLPAIDRHRLLLTHLSRFGELTLREQEGLGVTPQDVSAWSDALLLVRPQTLVVTPLFLWGVEGHLDPVRFTTRLAVRMTGEYLERAAKEPIEGIETYVWERFGFWHLAQPHPGEPKWHGYLTMPVAEPADLAASEKLDLFAHLPPLIISELVRDTSFLNEQQTWSAQASMKGSLGPLSRQMNLGIRRPLLLSDFDLLLDAGGGLNLGDLPESELLTRAYVVAGLPLCTGEEWQQNLRLSGDELSERILAHPLYALIVQFEVHRITAKLSGELAATVHRDHDNRFSLEIDGGNSMPLWLACRSLLEDLGFWPAAHSTKDAAWESAVSHALGNLENLGVLENAGSEIHLTTQFASKIKAHPSHYQNRGEKGFRVRLAQYLEKLSRGVS